MMHSLPVTAVVVVTLFCSNVIGQDTSVSDDSTERLAFMIGEWNVVETMHMMGDATGKGKMVAKWGPGKKSIVLDYETTEGRMVGFSMHEILLWDSDKKHYVLSYVTSFGSGLETLTGSRVNGRFEFVVSDNEGERLSTITRTDSGFTIASVQKKGEQETPLMTLEFEQSQ